MTPIPLIVLTGFLGSGKTTRINRWLAERGDLALIINELGDIGIDQDLAARVGTPVSLLAGGCVCCAVRGTLGTTLRNLYMARAGGNLPAFSAVLLETTGIADPHGVTAALEQDPWLRRRFVLRSVLTTVDAVAGEAALIRHPEALEQVTAADSLLLTKTERVDPGQLAALETALGRLNPSAEIHHAEEVDAGLLDRDFPRRCRITGLLTPAAATPAPVAAPPSGRAGHGLHPASIRWHGALPYETLRDALGDLLEAAGPSLIRLKGLFAVQRLDGPLMVQGVGAQPLEMTPLPAWPGDDRDNRLVLITDTDDAGLPARLLAPVRRRLAEAADNNTEQC